MKKRDNLKFFRELIVTFPQKIILYRVYTLFFFAKKRNISFIEKDTIESFKYAFLFKTLVSLSILLQCSILLSLKRVNKILTFSTRLIIFFGILFFPLTELTINWESLWMIIHCMSFWTVIRLLSAHVSAVRVNRSKNKNQTEMIRYIIFWTVKQIE